MCRTSPRILLLHIPPTDPLRRIYRLADSRSGILESPAGRSCRRRHEHPSDLDLVTAHATIPQLTSDPVSHTHQMPRVALLAKCPCYSSTCSVYNILSQVGRFCLQAHTTHVMPAEPSAFSHVVHTVGIYTHFVWRDSN